MSASIFNSGEPLQKRIFSSRSRLRVDLFWKRFCCPRKQTGSHKSCLSLKNGRKARRCTQTPNSVFDKLSNAVLLQLMTVLSYRKNSKFGTPQTIAIIVLEIEKFDVTLH